MDEGRVLLRVHVELSRAEQQECEHETNQRGETERTNGERSRPTLVSSDDYIVGKVNTNAAIGEI